MLVLNFILASLLFIGNTTPSPQECDAKPYKDKAIRSIPDGYTFLKSYTADGALKKEVVYSYIFTKNNNYNINLENGVPSAKGIYVTITDSNGKSQVSSFSNNKFYSALSYKCNATGMYKITFKFASQPYCAGAVLSFKR